MTKEEILQEVKFDDKGLVVCVIQDAHAKKVRMVAYMNKEALEKTLETKEMYYFSRSRQQLWRKGETSGNFQHLRGLAIDCDGGVGRIFGCSRPPVPYLSLLLHRLIRLRKFGILLFGTYYII